MITCQQAMIFCHKAQYEEASFFEKLKLSLHLFRCKACSKFSKRNSILTSLCDSANLNALSDEEKFQMKEKVRKAANF